MKAARIAALAMVAAMLSLLVGILPAQAETWRDGPCRQGEGVTVILDWHLHPDAGATTDLQRCIPLDAENSSWPVDVGDDRGSALSSAGLDPDPPAGFITTINGVFADGGEHYWYFVGGEEGQWLDNSAWSPRPVVDTFVGVSVVSAYEAPVPPVEIPAFDPEPMPGDGEPTGEPSEPGDGEPTGEPSEPGDGEPTGEPSEPGDGEPTSTPTSRPTAEPTTTPTQTPTAEPTTTPSSTPTTQAPPTAPPATTIAPAPTPRQTSRPTSRPRNTYRPPSRPNPRPVRTQPAPPQQTWSQPDPSFPPPPPPPLPPPPSPEEEAPQDPTSAATEDTAGGQATGDAPSAEPVWGREDTQRTTSVTPTDSDDPWGPLNAIGLGMVMLGGLGAALAVGIRQNVAAPVEDE